MATLQAAFRPALMCLERSRNDERCYALKTRTLPASSLSSLSTSSTTFGAHRGSSRLCGSSSCHARAEARACEQHVVKSIEAQSTKSSQASVANRRPKVGAGRREMLTNGSLLVASMACMQAVEVINPAHAQAFSVGFSGAKDWLRQQKIRTSDGLLKPIRSSRDRLTGIIDLVANEGATQEQVKRAKEIATDAARDCVAPAAGSFFSFQADSGVEVCTYALILKNGGSLLNKNDPLLLAAEARLGDLVRKFEDLISELDSLTSVVGPLSVDRPAIEQSVRAVQTSMDDFEAGVKGVLGVPV